MRHCLILPFALAACIASAAPLLADTVVQGEPVPLFRPASVAKVSKPPSEHMVGTVAVEVSVAELSKMQPGEKARVSLPSGVSYDLVMDRLERHAEGDLSWVGHVEGHATNLPVIVTLGAEGSYASIDTPEGRYGIAPGQGHDWLFDAQMSTIYLHRPSGTTDARVPPLGPMAKADPVCPDILVKPGTQTTIDVLFIMLPDFLSEHGGAANASTRLNSLVTQINTYYNNSNIATTLRRVAAINIAYGAAFGGPNDGALLDNITPNQAEFGFPFQYVETMRRLYGADMVAVMRGSVNGQGNSISGVAWVGGYNTSPITGSTNFMYSINGDTPLFSGTLVAHELGHNMGNQHDRANAGDPSPGATSYAYGFTQCGTNASAGCPTTTGNVAGTGGYGTIMSYWRPTTPKFASPNYTCPPPGGGTATTCGVAGGLANSADTVRSMNCTRAGIAGMRTDFLTGCNFATDTDGDGLPNCVENALGLSTSVKSNDIFTASIQGNVLFGMQQYRDFLGREADADGLHAQAMALQVGTTRASMTESFFNSPEFQASGAPIVRLYFAFYSRIPDFAGQMFHTGRLRAGVPLNTIAQDFATSQEFLNRYGALTNGQFVDLVYQNVLGRPADPAGRANALAQLDTLALTRGQLMVAFSESQEHINISRNRVYVAMMYAGMLRRTADQAGFNSWVGFLGGGNSGLTLVTQFLASLEYHNRFLP